MVRSAGYPDSGTKLVRGEPEKHKTSERKCYNRKKRKVTRRALLFVLVTAQPRPRWPPAPPIKVGGRPAQSTRLRASNSWRLCIDNNGGRRGTRVTTGQIGLPLPSLWTCPCQMACLCVPAFSYHRRPNSVHTGNFRVLLQHAVNDRVRISHHAP